MDTLSLYHSTLEDAVTSALANEGEYSTTIYSLTRVSDGAVAYGTSFDVQAVIRPEERKEYRYHKAALVYPKNFRPEMYL